MVLALTGYGLFPSKPKIGKSQNVPTTQNFDCEEVFECWLAWLRLALVWLVMSSIWVALGWECLHTTLQLLEESSGQGWPRKVEGCVPATQVAQWHGSALLQWLHPLSIQVMVSITAGWEFIGIVF